ncbi:MAG: ATPase [Hyphomonadaceae bacterium]
MATETAEHASGGGFPPFDQIGDLGISQVFWLVVTFAVLYIAAAYVFLPKIRQAMENRDGAIKADVAKAAALSAKADESVKQFETQIAAARANARDTASKAKAEADAKTAQATAAKEAEFNARLPGGARGLQTCARGDDRRLGRPRGRRRHRGTADRREAPRLPP